MPREGAWRWPAEPLHTQVRPGHACSPRRRLCLSLRVLCGPKAPCREKGALPDASEASALRPRAGGHADPEARACPGCGRRPELHAWAVWTQPAPGPRETREVTAWARRGPLPVAGPRGAARRHSPWQLWRWWWPLGPIAEVSQSEQPLLSRATSSGQCHPERAEATTTQSRR